MTKEKGTNIVFFIGCLLLFLCNVVPFTIYSIKIISFLFLLFSSLYIVFKSYRKSVSTKVQIWFFIYIGFGFFYSIVGMFNKPEQEINILRSSTVNVLWPILFFCIMPLFSIKNFSFKKINKTLVYSTFIIGLFLFLAGLSFMGVLPIPIDYFFNTKLIVGKTEASVQLFNPAVTSLMYLLPFLVCYFLLKLNKKDKLKGLLIIITFFLGIASVVITGRRALILNVLIAPIFFLIILFLIKDKSIKSLKKGIYLQIFVLFAIIFIISLILIQLDVLDVSIVTNTFVDSFDFNKNSVDKSSELRGIQFNGLMKSFNDYPIFGSGLGTHSNYIIRSNESPWIYELSYGAILYQTGITGMIIYLGLISYPILKSIKFIIKGEFMLLPHLIGLMCFLVANASNPYLAAFDHLWPLFLNIGFINYYMINNKQEKV